MSDYERYTLQDRLVVSNEPVSYKLTKNQLEPDQDPEALLVDHSDSTSKPPTNTTTLREVCADINGRVTRFLSTPPKDDVTRRTQEQTRVASSVIEQALQDYDFEGLSISYNGGKDCLVLLILYLSVLHTHFTQPSGRRKQDPANSTTSSTTTTNQGGTPNTFPTSIPSIYAKPPDPFDSVTQFVNSSTEAYHLDLVHIQTNPDSNPKSNSHTSPPPPTPASINGEPSQPTQLQNQISPNEPPQPNTNTNSNPPTEKVITFRDAFALYLQTHGTIKAIFVGTRRTDPHGAKLTHFQLTDGNWPRFMRIHPVIDWKLSEIWCFLRSEHLGPTSQKVQDLSSTTHQEDGGGGGGGLLDYCGMYDQGYTSLGGVGDTIRNPRLRYIDPETGEERYRPAYEMTEDEEERAGRE